jgi:hypothetical protein
MAASNPGIVLQEIRKTLGQRPDAEALKEILKALKDPAFAFQLKEYFRGLNDRNTMTQILEDLTEISVHCSGVAADRQNELTNTRYGIGVGGGLACSALLATIATPIALVAVFGGGWIVFTCVSRTGALRKEEQLYQDIAARSTKISEAFENARLS